MDTLKQWNDAFAIEGALRFVSGAGDMPVAEVSNALGRASIALQGAHVLSYQATGEQPLIWMSDEATYAPGKSLRGGVPICWPWFGPHASDSSLPGHGPARTVAWKPVASETLNNGATRISFELIENDKTRQMYSQPLRVQLHISVGSSLGLTLETTNLGDTPFTLGQALHTYFNVGDVRQVTISGMDGCSYIDKVDGGTKKQQQGDVTIASEVDRIYLGTGSQATIVDPVMNRQITITSSGSASTIIWNPWIENAEKMGDLGPDGYLHMLCVETANAADDVIELAAGASHQMVAEYSSHVL